MIMIVYNEAIDLEVMETLEQSGLPNYTVLPEAYGRGMASGTHLGTDVWPGRNRVLYVAAPEDQAAALMARLRTLREQYKREGLKAFVMPMEESL